MKKEIRGEILKARQALGRAEVTQKSHAVCQKIKTLGLLDRAETVMSYLPFRNEVDTCTLFDLLWQQGKRVVVPVCDVKNIALIPSRINSMDDVQPGTWGIPEPKAEALRPVNPIEIDLVIVPGVAFDPKGNRLGYGGGYYDRFLPLLKPGTVRAAVAFQMQIVDSLIPGPYDQPMDLVITETEVYRSE